MKKQYLWLLVAASLVAFGAGCKKKAANTNDNEIVNQTIDLNEALDLNVNMGDTDDLNVNDDETNTNDDTSNTNDADEDDTNTNTSSNSNKNSNTNSSNTGTTSSSGEVKITGPEADAELSSPFYVTGTATSGDSVYVRLVAGGSVIFTEKISVKSGKFNGKLLFEFTRTKSGTIEVFQKDGDDEEINIASVDVKFITTATNSNGNTNVSTNTNTGTNTNSDY